MAHFAQLNEANIVQKVIVVNNDTIENKPFPESEPIGIAFCTSLFGENTIWKQTSYNSSFRKNYAGIGYSYNAIIDAFIAPQPFPSWTLNTSTVQWEAPVPHPNNGQQYYWDETAQSWVLIPSTTET